MLGDEDSHGWLACTSFLGLNKVWNSNGSSMNVVPYNLLSKHAGCE
jgi:hypothetical protein